MIMVADSRSPKLPEKVNGKVIIKAPEYADKTNEPRSEKTGLRGFRPGPTQTGLYSYRRWLEA